MDALFLVLHFLQHLLLLPLQVVEGGDGGAIELFFLVGPKSVYAFFMLIF